MNTIPIIFSTITGNAYKLADAVAEVVPDHVGPYNIRYINDEVIQMFDTFILSYWCNHGTADDDTIALLRRMRRSGRRLRIPEGQKGHLSQERFEKQKESLGHPDAADLQGARETVRKLLQEL